MLPWNVFQMPSSTKLRGSDINCRYGGEEFVVLLAHADSDAAHLVAHRIISVVQSIRFREYPDLRLLVSIGLSCSPRLPGALRASYAAQTRPCIRPSRTGVPVTMEHAKPYTDSPKEKPPYPPFRLPAQFFLPTKTLIPDMSEAEKELMQETPC